MADDASDGSVQNDPLRNLLGLNAGVDPAELEEHLMEQNDPWLSFGWLLAVRTSPCRDFYSLCKIWVTR